MLLLLCVWMTEDMKLLGGDRERCTNLVNVVT